MTRLRSPLKQRGAHTIRWERWHAKNKAIVFRRCDWGAVCEGCEGRMKPLEWAHLASRGNVVSEPWCSTAALTAGLCRATGGELGCHEHCDRNLAPDLLARLRLKGLKRLCAAYGIDYLVGAELVVSHPEPLDAIRAAIRLLDMAWEWDSERGELVRS